MTKNTHRMKIEQLGEDTDTITDAHAWWVAVGKDGFVGHDGDAWCWTVFPRMKAYFPSQEAAHDGWSAYVRQIGGGGADPSNKPTFECAEGTPEELAIRVLVSMAIRSEVAVVAAFKGVTALVELGADWSEVLASEINR